jgi:flagellar biosynthesis protein FlhG
LDQAAALRLKIAGKTTDKPTLGTRARVIAVASGKGGVGKTNVAVNLSLALAQAGQKVLLFDADLGMANVDVVMGVRPLSHLSEVVQGRKTLSEVILVHNPDLHVIPGGSGFSEVANLSAPEQERLLRALKTIESHYDLILVDTGAGLSNGVLGFVLAAPEVIVVTTPEPTAITDAYGLIKTIDKNHPQALLHLIINMASSEEEALMVAQKLMVIVNRFLQVKIQFLSFIEKDAAVSKAVLQQSPFYLSAPASTATRKMKYIASRLLFPDESVESHQPAPISWGSFFRRASQLFNR